MDTLTAYTFETRHADGFGGLGGWIDLIHATNGIAPETFGSPTFTTANGIVTETYPAHTVAHDELSGKTTVTALTPEAGALLDRAAARTR